MLTKSEFLASLQREADATAHLAAKLTPAHLAFRFTAPQRSLQELICYLTVQLSGVTSHLVTGSWDAWEGYAKQAEDVTPANFAERMQRQVAEVRRLLDGVSDADFTSRVVKDLAGNDVVLSAGLTEYTLKFAVGYKMQLFLQAKAAGLSELVTSNLWFGCDPQPKADAAH